MFTPLYGWTNIIFWAPCLYKKYLRLKILHGDNRICDLLLWCLCGKTEQKLANFIVTIIIWNLFYEIFKQCTLCRASCSELGFGEKPSYLPQPRLASSINSTNALLADAKHAALYVGWSQGRHEAERSLANTKLSITHSFLAHVFEGPLEIANIRFWGFRL